MNPFYQMLSGSQQAQPQVSGGPQFQNPMQKMNYILQAMRNPAAFVKQQFPDIPEQMMNDPNQILSYLQRTRGITDQDIQKVQRVGEGWVR